MFATPRARVRLTQGPRPAERPLRVRLEHRRRRQGGGSTPTSAPPGGTSTSRLRGCCGRAAPRISTPRRRACASPSHWRAPPGSRCGCWRWPGVSRRPAPGPDLRGPLLLAGRAFHLVAPAPARGPLLLAADPAVRGHRLRPPAPPRLRPREPRRAARYTAALASLLFLVFHTFFAAYFFLAALLGLDAIVASRGAGGDGVGPDRAACSPTLAPLLVSMVLVAPFAVFFETFEPSLPPSARRPGLSRSAGYLANALVLPRALSGDTSSSRPRSSVAWPCWASTPWRAAGARTAAGGARSPGAPRCSPGSSRATPPPPA